MQSSIFSSFVPTPRALNDDNRGISIFRLVVVGMLLVHFCVTCKAYKHCEFSGFQHLVSWTLFSFPYRCDIRILRKL